MVSALIEKSTSHRGPLERGVRLAVSAVVLGLAVLVWASALGSGPEGTSELSPLAARTLEAKIQLLADPGTGAGGSQPIVISDLEANSYLKYRGRDFLPPGVSDPQVHIHPDRVSGAAEVDFNQLNQTGVKTDDWSAKLLAMLVTGKQRVAADGRLETASGQAKLKIENLQLGNTTLPDWLVAALLDTYVQKRYHVDLSKPLLLPDHVTHIELGDSRATFYRSPSKQAAAGSPQ